MERSPVLSLCLPPAGGDVLRVPPIEVGVEGLLEQALRLGVFPAVFNNLEALGLTASLPADSPWFAGRRRNYARNLALQHQEGWLLESLAQAGVSCRSIKGVRLVGLLYPDLSWRRVVDIDLLVPPDAVAGAYQALRQTGLQDAAAPWDAGALARQVAQPSHAFPEVLLVTPRRILVELHWDWVTDTFPAGDPAEDREAFLVYLCRHAGKHFWSSLQWVCDIELFLRRFGSRLDWDRFWSLARAVAVERSCAASFHLCTLLFDRLLRPEEAQVARAPGAALAREAAQRLLQPTAPQWSDHPAWRLLRVYNWRQRLSRSWSWLAPPPWDWNEPSNSILGVWLRRYRRLAFQFTARLAASSLWKGRLEKAADLSFRDWWTLAKAACMLLPVAVALRFVSFERLRRWATSVPQRSSLAPEEVEAVVMRQAWLVEAAANHYPVTMKCLPRSLTLARLLARRGIETDLKLGVRREAGRLEAHAWVECCGRVINGPVRPEDHFATLEPVASAPSFAVGDPSRG